MRTGIKPGKATPQQLDGEFSLFQVHLVDRGNLQFTAFGRFYPFRVLHHIAVIEIEAGYRPVGFWLLRFLFQRNRTEIVVKFHDAKAFRIHYLVAKDRCAFGSCGDTAQFWAKALTKEDVIAQHQARRFAVEERFANDKRLRQPIRARLFCILETHPVIRSVSQQPPESG